MTNCYTGLDGLPLFAQPAPSVRGSATSAAAADALTAKALTRMHRQVLAYLEQHGPATDEEMQAALAMNPSTQRPRRIELARRGLVVEAGEKRTRSGRRATAWKTTAASR